MTSASRETSQVTAVPPISSATCAAVAAFMSATTIAFAPSAANRRHSARPIPFPPPVTTMTFPVRFNGPSPSTDQPPASIAADPASTQSSHVAGCLISTTASTTTL